MGIVLYNIEHVADDCIIHSQQYSVEHQIKSHQLHFLNNSLKIILTKFTRYMVYH